MCINWPFEERLDFDNFYYLVRVCGSGRAQVSCHRVDGVMCWSQTIHRLLVASTGLDTMFLPSAEKAVRIDAMINRGRSFVQNIAV